MILTLSPITLNVDKTKMEYSSEECQSILKVYEDYYPKVGYHFPWVGYFVKLDDHIVGACGFVGPPINNRVEIAYGTFKEFEGQGIASYSCSELILIVKTKNPKLLITAKTAPEDNTSNRILKKNGFVYSGIVQDHEIGDAWEWVLNESK